MNDTRVSFIDLQPPVETLRADVLAGLASARKSIPPKYFYDAVGACLFDAICFLDEYYPTRTETAMMQRHAAEMAAALGAGAVLVEYGSGMSRKTRILLEALRPAAYVPIDISREALAGSAAALAKDYPWLRIAAICADYGQALPASAFDGLEGRRAVFFPGSTIGNFTPEEAVGFLASTARLVGTGGALLIGVDLKKAKARLDAAYNDPQGVTAAFNMNLLARINRELGADFDLAAFYHDAFYDETLGRIEMHLVSSRAQSVRIAGQRFDFFAGETIHTENSYKYGVEQFQQLAANAGYRPEHHWVDAERLFSVHLLRAI